MLRDVMYNILLQSNLNVICKLVQVNKETNVLCDDKHLWHHKFNQHQLRPLSNPIFCHEWVLEYDSIKKATEMMSYFLPNIKLYDTFFQCEIYFNQMFNDTKKMSFIPAELIHHMNKYNVLLDHNFTMSFHIKDDLYRIIYMGRSPDYNNARMGLDVISSEDEFNHLFFQFFYHHYHRHIKIDSLHFKNKSYSYEFSF